MASSINGSVLRLLDANANRAREALRVLEDYARFVLNDQDISAKLKSFRHTLAETLGPFLQEAMLNRDTPGDVGTTNKTDSEQKREDLAHVVTAAGKRLGEALRSIEEFLKTVSPAGAARIESTRYAFYDVEQRLSRSLHRDGRFSEVRLYVLITEKLCRLPWLVTAEQAILGGAQCIQLREKEMEGGELLRRAIQLVNLCRRLNAISIINDRPDIAILSDADGVHLGQGDLPATEVRKLLGSGKIIGVSTHAIEQARKAIADGADYIGVGPIFPSSTKPRKILPGPQYAAQVAREIEIPAIAIAGITAENVDHVLASGLRSVAVSSAVISAADVRQAATVLKDRLLAPPTPARPQSDADSSDGRKRALIVRMRGALQQKKEGLATLEGKLSVTEGRDLRSLRGAIATLKTEIQLTKATIDRACEMIDKPSPAPDVSVAKT